MIPTRHTADLLLGMWKLQQTFDFLQERFDRIWYHRSLQSQYRLEEGWDGSAPVISPSL